MFLLATTGMRRGEALGLRWTDLRLDDGQLDIRRSLGTVANSLVVGEPRTDKGRRTVSLDPPTVQVLREHRAEQLRQRSLMGTAYMANREPAAVRAAAVGSGRVARTRLLRLQERAALAARAQVRHTHTDYSQQLAALSPETDDELYRQIKASAHDEVDRFLAEHRPADR